ncbi:MAG: GNAT family N-acetyltransferase [Acidobacteriia bacterium]|nr:GNAT family N-acetyltransferase [Terriglobia bacterium]
MAALALIRTAGLTDADAVSALLRLSYSELLANSYDTGLLRVALPYMNKANLTLLVSGTYYVAETDRGIVVGCGGWTIEKPGSGEIVEGEAHIRHFAIHPEWTRRGIGTSILTRCIDEARSLGVRTLHCFSTLNAEPFYRAANFQTIRRIDVPMGQAIAFPAVLMQCQLA